MSGIFSLVSINEDPEDSCKYISAISYNRHVLEDMMPAVKEFYKDVHGLNITFEIEENTHRIISNKYSIRQPLNEGKNYINYLMSFSNAYNAIFDTKNKEDYYSKFNNKTIN